MKYFTLLCFSFLSLLAMAQNYSLTIFNNNGQQFFAVLNGIRQNSLPQTNLKISGMTAGSYELKLIFADGKTGDINKKFWLDESGDYLVRVDFKKGKGKLKYFGVTNQGQPGGTNIEYRPNEQNVYSDGQTGSTGASQGGNTQGNVSGTTNGSTTNQNEALQTSGNTGNGSMTTSTTVSDPTTNSGTVNFGMSTSTTVTDPTMNGGNGNVGMTTTVVDPVTNETINVNVDMNMSDPNLNGGMGNYGTTTTVTGTPNGTTTTSSSGSYHSTTTTTITENGTSTTTTTTENKTWGDGQPQTTGTVTGTQTNNWGTQNSGTVKGTSSYSCTEVLVDMTTVQSRLKGFTFEDDKYQYVAKDLAKYCMTTDQAIQILKTFTFEESKLDLAKLMYPRLTDKSNASKINSLFTFDASKDEFQEFIQSH